MENGDTTGSPLVPVQSVASGVHRPFEVALRLIDRPSGSRGVEDPEKREPESRWIQSAQLDVAAMAVGRVDAPSLVDVLRAVGLADVMASIAGVGDQVDPDDR